MHKKGVGTLFHASEPKQNSAVCEQKFTSKVKGNLKQPQAAPTEAAYI